MITNSGKDVVVEFFALQRASLVTYLSLGVGTTAESASDTALAFEVVRLPVSSISADLVNKRVIFMADLSPGQISTIYEIGAYAGDASDSGRLVSVADLTATWTNGTVVTTNARVGTYGVKVDYTASGTTNAETVEIQEDFSAFDASESVAIAFFPTANLSSLIIRLGTDASNYYEFLISSVTNGSYNVKRFLKSAATVTGTPDWSSITYMAVRPSATAGGSGSVYFDGLKFESSDGILVSRNVLGTPAVISTSIPTRIEYPIPVNVTP